MKIFSANALDLLYLKTSLRSSHLWGRDPKATPFYYTNRQRRNKYESVFFIPRPPVNFHINRGDFLLKIRGGPWTWSMDQVQGVVDPWTPVHVLYMSTIEDHLTLVWFISTRRLRRRSGRSAKFTPRWLSIISEKAKIHVEDLLCNLYGMQPGYVISNFKTVFQIASLFHVKLLKYVLMYQSNRSLNIPPGHTPGIWRLLLPGREGIWST